MVVDIPGGRELGVEELVGEVGGVWMQQHEELAGQDKKL